MEKTITNKNAHYQIPTTNYQLKICFHCAKVCNIPPLSICSPSPLTRRGQGEVEMAHKYVFTVQKCAIYSSLIEQGARFTHQTPVSCVIVCNKSFSNEENKTYQPDY